MTKNFGILALVLTAVTSTAEAGWKSSYECVANNAKKSLVTFYFLDPEVLKTHEAGQPDRYYRVTETSEEVVEAMILGHRAGENARMTPVLKGTMNITMTQMEPGKVTASVKVGKLATTFSCK